MSTSPFSRPGALVAGALSLAATTFASSAPAYPVRAETRTSVNADRNVNVNHNVNVNRNVNVNTGYHGGYGYGYGYNYHPVATAAAVGAATAVTGAAIGSVVHTLPPSCTTIVSAGVTYRHCGDAWYQPQYSGSQVTYVVVNQP